jgi:hypothetical protein
MMDVDRVKLEGFDVSEWGEDEPNKVNPITNAWDGLCNGGLQCLDEGVERS